MLTTTVPRLSWRKEAVKAMTGLCNCIWKRKEWSTDCKKSVYVTMYKNGDKKECGNYRTISLISHASKVLLRVINRRLEVFLIPELPIEQAGSDEEEEHVTT